MDRAKATGGLRENTEPEGVPMMICALGGAAEMQMMSWERYVAIAIDGFRAPGSTPLARRWRSMPAAFSASA